MEPTFQIAVATGVGASIGALIGNAFVLINGWRERIAQNRRLLREAAFNAGIEYWKAHFEMAHSERMKGRPISVAPMDVYLLPLIGVADAISNDSIDDRNIHALMNRFHALTAAAMKSAREYSDSRK